MRRLSSAGRRILEGGFLLSGVVLVLVSGVFAVFTITTPGCAVDADDAAGVLAVRILGACWVASVLVSVVVAVVVFRRAPAEGWSRVVASTFLPVAASVLWLAWAGLTGAVLAILGAGEGSSACV